MEKVLGKEIDVARLAQRCRRRLIINHGRATAVVSSQGYLSVHPNALLTKNRAVILSCLRQISNKAIFLSLIHISQTSIKSLITSFN